MKLIDQIERNWPAAMRLRLALISEDPHPTYSYLDIRDDAECARLYTSTTNPLRSAA